MAGPSTWDNLPYDITYLIFRELSFLDDTNSKESWQDIVNCFLVCKAWNEALRFHLCKTGPVEPLLTYGSETLALAALERELRRRVVLVSKEEGDVSIGKAEKEAPQMSGTKGLLDHHNELAGKVGPKTNLPVKTTTDPSEEYPGMKRLEDWLYHSTNNSFVRCMRVLLVNNAPIVPPANTHFAAPFRPSLLTQAVRNRCFGAVKLLLDQGPHKMPRRYADLAIVVAYEVRHVPSIEALLKYGAWRRTLVSAESLDHVEEMRIPPLSYAVEANDKDMVALLVNYLDKDEEDWDEFPSPLVRAVRRNNLAMTCHLLRLGFSPNPKIKKMPLALAEAARMGFEEAMDLLVDWGADANDCDEQGFSALDYALCDGETRIVDKLLEFNATISETTFRAAALCGSVRGMKRLLDRRQLMPPSLPSYGLCEAVIRGEENMVEVFLKHGIEMSHRGTSRHALYVAVGQGDFYTVRQLLDYGQRTQSLQPEHGAVALCTAITTQNVSVTQLLLSRGANPNAPTREYTSALHAALPTGKRDLVRVLLMYGADVHTKSASGVSIMDAALSTGSQEIVDLITEYGGNPGDVTANMMDLVSGNGAGASNGERD